MKETVISELKENARIANLMAERLADEIVEAANLITDAYRRGGKLLLIGNGGSAADAQHIAAELVGRLRRQRIGLAALALTTNTSVLTALANDYDYENVFSAQIEALAGSHDVLVAITTSGTSANILRAVAAAKAAGLKVIGLTGESGGKLVAAADLTIKVPSDDTARIQESHITIGHIICHLVEEEMRGK
jgi:D-sedoheptulose 7-phosphate isomerase